MAFDEGLAQRIRDVLGSRPFVTERQMFGGLAFLLDGKMFVGILNSRLMARVGPERYQDALALPYVHEMDFPGKPLNGYVYIDSPGLEDDKALEAWVTWCAVHAASLPLKKPKKLRRRTGI